MVAVLQSLSCWPLTLDLSFPLVENVEGVVIARGGGIVKGVVTPLWMVGRSFFSKRSFSNSDNLKKKSMRMCKLPLGQFVSTRVVVLYSLLV